MRLADDDGRFFMRDFSLTSVLRNHTILNSIYAFTIRKHNNGDDDDDEENEEGRKIFKTAHKLFSFFFSLRPSDEYEKKAKENVYSDHKPI